MEPIRILEYITPSSLGGAEHALLRLGDELQSRGHQVLFVSPQGRSLTTALQEKGFKVWAPRTYGKLDPLTLLRLVRLVQSERIEVIHTHLSTASLLGSFAGRIVGVPAVATVHGLNSAFSYRFTKKVLPVSIAVTAHLEAQGLKPDRMTVIPNGIDVARFQELPDRNEARRSLGIPIHALVMLYAGRLSPEKGVLLLPGIVKAVRDQLPAAILLVLGDGALREDLQAGLKEHGVDHGVQMLGYQPDTRPYLAAADILVAPSYKEGMPLAILEAMTAGLPVVGTRAGGIGEIILSGETGELAPIGDVDALATACVRLLRDVSLRESMGRAGRARAVDNYSLRESVNRLEAVFGELIGR